MVIEWRRPRAKPSLTDRLHAGMAKMIGAQNAVPGCGGLWRTPAQIAHRRRCKRDSLEYFQPVGDAHARNKSVLRSNGAGLCQGQNGKANDYCGQYDREWPREPFGFEWIQVRIPLSEKIG